MQNISATVAVVVVAVAVAVSVVVAGVAGVAAVAVVVCPALTSAARKKSAPFLFVTVNTSNDFCNCWLL